MTEEITLNFGNDKVQIILDALMNSAYFVKTMTDVMEEAGFAPECKELYTLGKTTVNQLKAALEIFRPIMED